MKTSKLNVTLIAFLLFQSLTYAQFTVKPDDSNSFVTGNKIGIGTNNTKPITSNLQVGSKTFGNNSIRIDSQNGGNSSLFLRHSIGDYGFDLTYAGGTENFLINSVVDGEKSNCFTINRTSRNVGIGTNTSKPITSNLQVGNEVYGTNSSIRIDCQRNSSSSLLLRHSTGGDYGFNLTHDGAQRQFKIISTNGGNENTRLFIKRDTGQIGINTETIADDYMLAVNGKIGATEIEVSQNNWADYVFKEDYKLMPLGELENFIKENNHLPEVPSEKEVIENGINLGNMDALLLKKIEELTLYVIQLKKENDELKDFVKKNIKK